MRSFARIQDPQERAIRLDHDAFLGGELEERLLRGIVVRLQHYLITSGQMHDPGGWAARISHLVHRRWDLGRREEDQSILYAEVADANAPVQDTRVQREFEAFK